MKLKTPRTDSNLLLLDCDDSCLDIYVKTEDGKDFYGDIVSAEISRELERENAELIEALDTLSLVIGLTPIAGNKEALQEALNLARAVIAKSKSLQ